MRSTSPKTYHGSGNFPFSIRIYIYNISSTLADFLAMWIFMEELGTPENISAPENRPKRPKVKFESSSIIFQPLELSGEDMVVSWRKTVMAFQHGVYTKVPQKPRNNGSTNSSMRSSSSNAAMRLGDDDDGSGKLTSWGWYFIHLYPIIYRVENTSQVVGLGISEPSTAWTRFLELETC